MRQDVRGGRKGPSMVAMVVAVVAVGILGYVVGSSPGSQRPAVAVPPGPGDTEAPRVSDPPAGTVPSAGIGRDPSTPAELAGAGRIAVDPDLRAATTDVAGEPGPEVLSVQLAEPDPASPGRRAVALLYDYRTDRLIKRVIDLSGNRLTGTFAATGRQPPATTREVATAAGRLWRDPLGGVLRDRFRAMNATELTSLGQVSFEAETFTAASGATGPAAECGKHRCVTLLPHRAGQQFLDLTDIVVDLSARTVVRLS